MFKTSSVRIFRGYSPAVLACRTDPNDRFTHLPKSWRGVLTVASYQASSSEETFAGVAQR